MFVIARKEGNQPLISEKEKEILKADLKTALNLGGRYLFIKSYTGTVNKISVFNENKECVGYIVGNSAIIVTFLNDNVFMGVPIDIKWVIDEYLS